MNRYIYTIGGSTILAILVVTVLAYRSTISSSQLHEAVLRSDIQELKRLLEKGRNIDQLNRGEIFGIGIRKLPMKYESEVTPLNVAVGKSDPVVVSFLLDNGADVNIGVGGYGSMLRWALIQLAPSIDFHETPLRVTFSDREASIEVIRLLIEHGADVNYQDYGDGETPLEMCERLGEFEVCEKMRRWSREYNATD